MCLPESLACQHNSNKFIQVCKDLGVPLALEKVEDPTTCLIFLGIILGMARMEIRLPEDKMVRIRQEVARWLLKKKATKKEILSLVGLLQHATKVVRCGRTFVGRLYSTAAKLKEMAFYTRLNIEFKWDLYWDLYWRYFPWIAGMALVCIALQTTQVQKPTVYKLMHRDHGAAVPYVAIGGSSGLVGRVAKHRYNGQRVGSYRNQLCMVWGPHLVRK